MPVSGGSALSELAAAFELAETITLEETHRTLKEIGMETRDLARMIAQGKGLDGATKGYSHSRDPHPGALIAKIRVYAGTRSVSITESSRSHSEKYPSYPYPRRYEWGDRHRPFMTPARDAETPLLAHHFEVCANRILSRAGVTRG